MRRLLVSAGSLVGREHLRLHRNNQDGVAVLEEPGLLVAVVTDGCSAGRSSEVGARLGAAFLASQTLRLARRGVGPGLAAEACDALEGFLRGLADALCPSAEDLARTVEELLLFGFLCAAVDQERALVFGVGDGVWSLNGRASVIDPGPKNAPPYLAYRLVGSAVPGLEPASLEPAVHHLGPAAELESLVLATDGLAELRARADEPLVDGSAQGDVRQFEVDAKYARNPALVQRRLVVLGELNRRIRDDATLVVVRREPPSVGTAPAAAVALA